MEELAHCCEGVELLDFPVAVNGLIAQRIDDPRLAETQLRQRLP